MINCFAFLHVAKITNPTLETEVLYLRVTEVIRGKTTVEIQENTRNLRERKRKLSSAMKIVEDYEKMTKNLVF